MASDSGSSGNWIGAIGSAAGSGLGTALELIFRDSQNQRTIDVNKELADYAYSQDVDMWNRQNEYNLPSAQVQRLRDAGLNPALMYKGAPQNVATQLPKYQKPTADFRQNIDIPVESMLANYQNVRMRQAQIDNVNAQKNLTDEKATTEAVSRAWQQFMLDKEDWKWSGGGKKFYFNDGRIVQKDHPGDQWYYPELSKYSVDTAGQKHTLTQHQAKLAHQATLYKERQNKWYNRQMWMNMIGSGIGSGARMGLWPKK